MEQFAGRPIPAFEYRGNGIGDINQWILSAYAPVIRLPGAVHAALEGAFRNALDDGVTLLEMSIDVTIGRITGMRPEEIVNALRSAHQKVAPQIRFRPCMGFARNMPVSEMMTEFGPYLDSGFFHSIDLYDDELSQPSENFKPLFRMARNAGLKCRAHAGEFGDAESVRKTAEVLELDAIQHGIAAASSPDVMRWLAERKIPLNICPTSNVILGVVSSMKEHPIRILFDHGVIVTVNTDDLMLFDQSVTQEYLNLYRAGVFTADELEVIRQNGLAC
jgi:adenosine deaminase